MDSKVAVVRIVIADDHTIFRDGLRRLLEAEPELEVVGEAADGNEAVAQTR
jgi:DNA-binding NarL/FixJ family response regulator